MTTAALQAEPQPNAPAVVPTAKRSKAKVVLPVLIGVAAVVGGGIYLHGRGKQTTDDAFVESHVASIAPRVPGQVLHVLVRDNQSVAAGDVLVELDERDATARAHAARADLASAEANLAAANAQLSLSEHSIDASLR